MAGSVRVLLLTDLEGSTRLWAEHAALMVDVMADHHAIVHAAIAAHGGTRPVDQGEGDAVFASFPSATDAVAAVLRFQRELEEHAWPEGITLLDRVGLHVGEVEERDGNLFGVGSMPSSRARAETTRPRMRASEPPGGSRSGNPIERSSGCACSSEPSRAAHDRRGTPSAGSGQRCPA